VELPTPLKPVIEIPHEDVQEEKPKRKPKPKPFIEQPKHIPDVGSAEAHMVEKKRREQEEQRKKEHAEERKREHELQLDRLRKLKNIEPEFNPVTAKFEQGETLHLKTYYHKKRGVRVGAKIDKRKQALLKEQQQAAREMDLAAKALRDAERKKQEDARQQKIAHASSIKYKEQLRKAAAQEQQLNIEKKQQTKRRHLESKKWHKVKLHRHKRTKKNRSENLRKNVYERRN